MHMYMYVCQEFRPQHLQDRQSLSKIGKNENNLTEYMFTLIYLRQVHKYRRNKP